MSGGCLLECRLAKMRESYKNIIEEEDNEKN